MKKTTKISYESMTEALRQELFALSQPTLNGKALAEEVEKATAMAYLAQSIANIGRFEMFDLGSDLSSLKSLPVATECKDV